MAIKYVLKLPINECFNILVNLEFLKGIYYSQFFIRLLMHFPKANKDLLILAPSHNKIPLF